VVEGLADEIALDQLIRRVAYKKHLSPDVEGVAFGLKIETGSGTEHDFFLSDEVRFALRKSAVFAVLENCVGSFCRHRAEAHHADHQCALSQIDGIAAHLGVRRSVLLEIDLRIGRQRDAEPVI